MRPQSYMFPNLEEYAIAMLIYNGSEQVLYPPNRYLWDMLPDIYITRHHLIALAARERNSIPALGQLAPMAWGLDMTQYNLDTVIL